MAADLRMVQMFVDQKALFEHFRKLSSWESKDLGYLVHALLKELFGELSPKPFAIMGPKERRLEILAYSTHNQAKLREYASTHAEPVAYRSLDWDAFAEKFMPDSFRRGSTFHFKVRACPIVRQSRTGNEVDVFLSEILKSSGPIENSRQQLYARWLRARLEASGAVICRNLTLESMRLTSLRRRDNNRQFTDVQRPDVVFNGAFEVKDAGQLPKLLARGIGRHRAFGYGMILLRRRPT